MNKEEQLLNKLKEKHWCLVYNSDKEFWMYKGYNINGYIVKEVWFNKVLKKYSVSYNLFNRKEYSKIEFDNEEQKIIKKLLKLWRRN